MSKVIDFEARRQQIQPEREHARKEAKAKQLRAAFGQSRKAAEGASRQSLKGSSGSVEKLKNLFKNKDIPKKK